MKILSTFAAIVFFAVGAMAQTTNDLSDAEIQGRNLARQLLEQSPTTNLVQAGILNIRDVKGMTTNVPVKFEAIILETGWANIYEPYPEPNAKSFPSMPSIPFIPLLHSEPNFFYEPDSITNTIHKLIIKHFGTIPNQYEMLNQSGSDRKIYGLYGPDAVKFSFENSDFNFGDLGLEFFHWPEQKILKRENSRGCICKVLESTNPNPSANGYSRVDSWIDEETLGIVQAYAYDAQGKKLKEFYPKDVKKVNGQWQVETMEMDNVQTGSRSRIEFDLKK